MLCTCPLYPGRIIYLDNNGRCTKCGGFLESTMEKVPLTYEKHLTMENENDTVDVIKVKRRIIDWLHKTAKDEEIYEIAWSHNIKTD